MKKVDSKKQAMVKKMSASYELSKIVKRGGLIGGSLSHRGQKYHRGTDFGDEHPDKYSYGHTKYEE